MPEAKPYVIPKQLVWDAYQRVKANQGAAGVDGETLAMFEKDLQGNLYKLWNRMSSGAYFPPAVRLVEIPKESGGTRPLGIPTVADRIAQTVVKMVLEPLVEPTFHGDSYGYRPGKSALDAIAVARERCWHADWVIDLDIKSFFDCLDHDLVERAVAKHTDLPWVRLYIARWLRAPLQRPDGTEEPRTRGTPQGGVISPLLANLFLHYAFDAWMSRTFPAVPFERYADDAIVHCRSGGHAKEVLDAIRDRFKQCGLELHPVKTRVVYCKDDDRRGNAEHVSFDFLGYTFQPRRAKNRWGKYFVSFLPAISATAAKSIYQLIVGDLDQVPLAVQQVQATDGFVGRIAFDDLDGYRAYADKVVRWEDRPATAAEGCAILHAVRDGTSATRRGYEALIAPAEDILRRRRSAGDVRYGELRVTGSERPAPDELWAAATEADGPGVMLSFGHGVGVPRAGRPWAARGGAERQRREQGALSFGRGGVVTGADVAGRGLLPGGMWLAIACFSAGTAETSDYRHWLDTLRRTGHAGSEIEHVLDTLAHERPFVAAVPKAALADPRGPLAFVGHVDLAWTYSFFDHDDRPQRRPGRIVGVIQSLLNRHRAGVAMRKLLRFLAEVNTELTALHDAQVRAGPGAIESPGSAGARSNATRSGGAIDDHERARRGHLWMLRQDLAGYVLLGDPAVRLPISDGGGGAGREGDARASGTARAAGEQADEAVTRTESAVLAVLGGDPVAVAARRHGFDRAELEHLVASYRAAGRDALETALQARRSDRGS